MDFDTHARIILKFIVRKQNVSIWKRLNSVVNGFKDLFISSCSLAACLIVTAKLYFEQETAGTATTEFAEFQVQ
jgi:hypothetical protein